jgi:hypothetical protein
VYHLTNKVNHKERRRAKGLLNLKETITLCVLPQVHEFYKQVRVKTVVFYELRSWKRVAKGIQNRLSLASDDSKEVPDLVV